MNTRTVAVVVLVLLAGCSGVAPGGTTPETDTETVTPVPVPTEADTPTATPQRAPGIGQDGIDSPFALASAHDGITKRSSHVRWTNQTIRYPNGTLRRQVIVRRAVAREAGRYHQHLEVRGRDVPRVVTPVRAELWSDGAELLKRFESGGNVTYGRLAEDEYRARGSIYVASRDTEDRLYVLVSLFETRLGGRDDTGDSTRYRVVSTGVQRPEALERFVAFDEPRDVRFRAVVTERGLIESFRLSYEGERDGTAVRVVRSARYTGVGETTVDRPAWYDAARNATGDVPDVPEAGGGG